MTGIHEGRIREAWDRVVASDPGLVRARMAVGAAVAMTFTLTVEFGYANARHDPFEGVVIAMLLGGVIAMMGSMALNGVAAWPKVRTAVFFPVALGAGMLPGVAVTGHTDAMLTVFVVVMFLAVWVRRFGPAFFFYGFMLWMGYFFAAFLGATVSMLPGLLLDVLVATACSLLLAVTVLRTHPGRTLRRVQRAFGARARAVARACADLLEATGDPDRTRRAARRLHTRSLRLAEAALMIEAWSAEAGALPDGWSGAALRRRLLDAQLAIDVLAHASVALAEQGGELVPSAARVAGHLARREYPAVLYAARPLLAGSTGTSANVTSAMTTNQGPAQAAALRLASAAVDYCVLAGQSETPPEVDLRDDYTPAATLAMGVLPGSPAVAGGLPARGRWNPLNRVSLTSRQAVQVAVAGTLAILLGRQVSETRYYWAVIATFVTFTGTATRSETSLKAANRVVGTLLGLGVGIGLAELTAGHTVWVLVVIVASMTTGFYLVNLSYAAMIFFVTIMVAQLYSVLHEFTPGLLVLRLEETALGAAIGIAVGLVVLPTGTRDTIQAARRAFLDALALVLNATASRLESDDGGQANPAALTRSLEDRMRQLALVSRPLTRPLISGTDPRATRHGLTLYAAAARHARALAALPGRIADPVEAAEVAASCRALALTATDLANRGVQDPVPVQAAVPVSVPIPFARNDIRPETDAVNGGKKGTATATAKATAVAVGVNQGPGAEPAPNLYGLLTALADLSVAEEQRGSRAKIVAPEPATCTNTRD